MSVQTKNQKWIFIGVAVIAILGLVYWYFTKSDTKSLEVIEDGNGNSTAPLDGKKPGEANSIADLPAACKVKFNSWYKWLSNGGNPSWFAGFEEIASKKNTSAYKEASNYWLRAYNIEKSDYYAC